MHACSLSHVQLCDSMDCSLPGSTVHGIILVRILEWVIISFSKGSSWPRDRTCMFCGFCIGRQILYHWMGDATKEIYFFLTPSRILKSSAWLWGRKWLVDQQTELLEGIKGTEGQLTVSWTLSGSLSMSCWEGLTCRSPKWPSGTSNAIHASLAHTPPHDWLPLCTVVGRESKPLQTASEHTQKAGPALLDWERANTTLCA